MEHSYRLRSDRHSREQIEQQVIDSEVENDQVGRLKVIVKATSPAPPPLTSAQGLEVREVGKESTDVVKPGLLEPPDLALDRVGNTFALDTYAMDKRNLDSSTLP